MSRIPVAVPQSPVGGTHLTPPPPMSRSNVGVGKLNRPDSAAGSDLSATRKKQSKRDEAIRKKIENELSRKRPAPKRAPGQPSAPKPAKPKQGTVSALRPLPALTVPDSISVADASQLCAAKRTDCVLVVDDDEHLCGIFTAKDLAFRVVGDGLDPRTTPVSAIMTPNPMVTRDTTSATEALQTMVTRGFRHLPVCNEEGDVVGLLDITKVFNESLEKLEKAYGSSQKLYSALEGAQEHFGSADSSNPLLAYVQALRDKMNFPDLGSILDARTAPATVGVKTTVRDAARLMRERRTTAVCVMENEGGKIAGIFTSKDVVLRVIAAGLEARTCSVVRVMTPHPDTALPSLSIQDALRKMHDGHYLNLPVVDETGDLIGIVDVLKLTYATLDQVNSIGQETTDTTTGPVWGKFFNAVDEHYVDEDTESLLSASHSHAGYSDLYHTPSRRPPHHGVETPGSDLFPNDSVSVVYEQTHPSEVGGGSHMGGVIDDGTYLFKFVAPGGTTHRFQARYDSYEFIVDIVRGKLGSDPFFIESAQAAASAEESRDEVIVPPVVVTADPSDFQMSYFDDDGDLVLMTSDRDMLDSVAVAKKQGKDRVVLHLRGGKGWEDELNRKGLNAASAAAATKKKEELLKRIERVVEEEEEEESPKPNEKKKKVSYADDDELVFGFLKKDQLLPASVALLAATIVGVFVASRVTSSH